VKLTATGRRRAVRTVTPGRTSGEIAGIVVVADAIEVVTPGVLPALVRGACRVEFRRMELISAHPGNTLHVIDDDICLLGMHITS
jgi:hypothetical protein